MKKFNLILLALLFILILISASYKAQSFCSDADKETLAKLWLDFGEPALTNWDFNTSPNVELTNDWEGITMTSDGCHIQTISLINHGLQGVLSPYVGDLNELNNLNLSTNYIGGSLPNEIGNLTNLTILDIGQNVFDGNIPNSIENLSNLEYMDLGNNYFTGTLNPDYDQLTNLRSLILRGNYLSGSIPSTYGNISSLELLNVQSNDLTGTIPLSLGNLNNMHTLSLASNDITGPIPESLGDLPSLYIIRFQNSLITGSIPSNLLIYSIWMHNTQISGCIPESFAFYCSDPDRLRIEDNPFLDNDDFSTFCSSEVGMCIDHRDFVTTWKTSNIGTTNDNQIFIPTYAGATYNYDVDWEDDGTFDEFGITGNKLHTYSTPGEYTVRIRGTFPGIEFNFSMDKDKIVSVDQWGTGEWTNMIRAFFGCSNLSIFATDAPNLTMITDMTSMFATSGVDYHFSHWDVSNVTTMNNIFLNVELSTPNYDALLISWSQQTLQSNVNFRATNSVYCAGAWARESMIESNNWTIFDGGVCGDFMTLSLKINLQGPFDESQSEMVPLIKDHPSFPTTDPYESFGYPHVVGGGEQIGAGVLNQSGNGEIVDWVVVEVRDGENPLTVLETHSGLLRKDGSVASAETGNSGLEFYYPGSHYNSIVIAINHRNHLGVILSDPIALAGAGQEIQIDFSNLNTNLTGEDEATYTMSGRQTMRSGDANYDGVVNAVDKNNFWRTQNGNTYNYLNSTGDFNLDGVINSIDKNNHWRISNGKSSFVFY